MPGVLEIGEVVAVDVLLILVVLAIVFFIYQRAPRRAEKEHASRNERAIVSYLEGKGEGA